MTLLTFFLSPNTSRQMVFEASRAAFDDPLSPGLVHCYIPSQWGYTEKEKGPQKGDKRHVYREPYSIVIPFSGSPFRDEAH